MIPPRDFFVLLGALVTVSCGGGQPQPKSPEPGAAPEGAPAESETPAGDSSGAPADEAAPSAAPRAYGSEPTPGSARKAEERDSAAPQGEIEALSRELDQTLQLSTPDCTTAWTLRDRICDLADRLCDLASRSGEPELTERCTDGKARCQRATSRIRATCSE